MKVVLVTGLSGSGKSVALKALEDRGFFCIDNLPSDFLIEVVQRLRLDNRHEVAVAIDARTLGRLDALPNTIHQLRLSGADVRLLYLDADDATLVQRYSESRRRHPASYVLGNTATIQECVEFEREALSTLEQFGDRIDTTGLLSNALRQWIEQAVVARQSELTLIFESFAFKRGTPLDADLMFDARCLPNPFYDKELRHYSGLDLPVMNFFEQYPSVAGFIVDIEVFLEKWMPHYLQEQRNYLTVAVGCTGGQHRSVYVTQQLANIFMQKKISGVQAVLIRHRSVIPISGSTFA